MNGMKGVIPRWKAYKKLFAAIRGARGWKPQELAEQLTDDARKCHPECSYSPRALIYWSTAPTSDKRSNPPSADRVEHLHEWLSTEVAKLSSAKNYSSALAAIAPPTAPNSLSNNLKQENAAKASDPIAAFHDRLRIESLILRQKLFPPVPSTTGPDQIDTGEGDNLIPLFLVEQGQRVSMLDAMQQRKRLLLIGRPGAGKTALSLITAVALLNRKWQLPTPGSVGAPTPLPVLIRLKLMAEAMFSARESKRPGKGLEFEDPMTFIVEHLVDGGLPKEFLNQTVSTGAYVFLFDGLDEVPLDYHIDIVLGLLSDRLGDDWMIVCTRPRSEEVVKVLGPSFWRLHLSDLTATDKWELLRKRFESRSDLEAFWTKLNGLPSDWAELTSTPLILSVLAYLFQKKLLPDMWDLCTVYDRTIELLLGEFTDTRSGESSRFERRQRVLLFDALCAVSFEKNDGRIDAHLNFLVTEPEYWPEGCPPKLLDSFWDVDDAAIFYGPPEKKEPMHRTFTEFGYARFLSKLRTDSTERILRHWQELGATSWVPVFYVQLVGGARADQLAMRLSETVDDASPRTILDYARVVYNSQYLRERHKAELEPRLIQLWRSGTFGRATNRPVNTEIGQEAARCLGLDPDFVAKICERLEHQRDVVDLSMTADLLKDMRSPHCYRQLVNFLDATDNRVRWTAVVSLGELNYYATVAEFLRKDRFEREEDWDIQIAMLNSAGKVPSGQLEVLLALAIKKPRREIVKWHAETMARSIRGGGLLESLIASDSAARSASSDEERMKIFTEIADRVWHGVSSSKQTRRLEATAAILKVGELSLAFRKTFCNCLVPQLVKSLHQPPLNKKQTWRVAWSLRSLLNVPVSPCVKPEHLFQILDTLDPRTYGLARGEILAVFGELRELASVPYLSRTYSLENDEHERLWTMHSLWKLAHSQLSATDLRSVRAACEKAARSDNYERARHWARLTLQLIRRKTRRGGQSSKIQTHKKQAI